MPRDKPELPTDTDTSDLALSELPAHPNIVTIPRTCNSYYLGDIVSDFHYQWHFEGDLTRYKESPVPALAFFNELLCVLSEVQCPPQELTLKCISPLEYSKPEPGILEETMLKVFTQIGKLKIKSLHLEGFEISESVFIEMCEQMSYKVRDGQLTLESLHLSDISFSSKRFSSLIYLLRNNTTISNLVLHIELTEKEISDLIHCIQRNPCYLNIDVRSTSMSAEQTQLLSSIYEERKAKSLIETASPFERFVMSCQIAFADEKKQKLNCLHEANLYRTAQTVSSQAFHNMQQFIENADYQLLAYRTGVAARASGKVEAKDTIGEYASEAMIFGGHLIQKATGFDPTILAKLPVFVEKTDLNDTSVRTLGSYLNARRVKQARAKEHKTALLIERIRNQDSTFLKVCILRLAETYEPIIHLLSTEKDVRIFTQAVTEKLIDALYKCATKPELLRHRSLMDTILGHVVNPLATDDPLALRLRRSTNKQKIKYHDKHQRKVIPICIWDAVEIKNLVFENKDKHPKKLTYIDLESETSFRKVDGVTSITNRDSVTIQLPARGIVYAISNTKHERFCRRAIRHEVGTLRDKQLVYYPDGYAFYAEQMKALVSALEEAKASSDEIVADLHIRFARITEQSKMAESPLQPECLSPAPTNTLLYMHSTAPPLPEPHENEEPECLTDDPEIGRLEKMLNCLQKELSRVKTKRK